MRRATVAAGCLLSLAWTGGVVHAHGILFGHNQAGKIVPANLSEFQHHLVLNPVSGLLNGWTDVLGFDHVTANDPADDIFVLAPGAEIWAEIISIDPALRFIDPAFSIYDASGEQAFLGGSDMHIHMTWQINSSDPAFDPDECEWLVTLVFFDQGSTNYLDSDPITLKFTNKIDSDPDCNGNGIRDECDISLGLSQDCNNDSVPDDCHSFAVCGDGDTCTCDFCTSDGCGHMLVRYGDTNCNGGQPNLDDILCVLAGFAAFQSCPNGDLAPFPTGNNAINLDDILAVLGAFSGQNPCN